MYMFSSGKLQHGSSKPFFPKESPLSQAEQMTIEISRGVEPL